MEHLNLIKDSDGNTNFVVLPRDFFNQFFPEDFTIQALTEYFEDLGMNNAMDEAKKTDLISLDEAVKYMATLE